jgi:hypothetical protein
MTDKTDLPNVGKCRFALFIGYDAALDPDAVQDPGPDAVLDEDDVQEMEERFELEEWYMQAGRGFRSCQGLYEEFANALHVAREVAKRQPVWWHIADLTIFEIVASSDDLQTLQ